MKGDSFFSGQLVLNGVRLGLIRIRIPKELHDQLREVFDLQRNAHLTLD